MQAPFYPNYAVSKLWSVLPVAAVVQQHMKTYEAFPPRAAPPEMDNNVFVAAILKKVANGIGN
jgi:arylsulfatase